MQNPTATGGPGGIAAGPPAPEEAGGAAATTASLPSRLLGVLVAPARGFRQVLARPAWIGAFVVYMAAIGGSALVYGLRVDWDGYARNLIDESLMMRMMLSILPDEQAEVAERDMILEFTATGQEGMALRWLLQALTGGLVYFHFMGILFATLFSLMGALPELKLGRVYLDGLYGLAAVVVWVILTPIARLPYGEDVRAALPAQIGLNSLFVLLYAWILGRAASRQAPFRALMSVFAHSLVVSAAAAALTLAVVLLRRDPLTVDISQVLVSNAAGLVGLKGTAFAATFLARLDLFVLWQLSVLSVGFAALTRFSVGMAASITFLPWGFVTMLQAAAAAVFGG